MNPFDLPGPAFLLLYVVVVAAAFFVARRMPAAMRGPNGEPGRDLRTLEPFDVAYLANGAAGVVETALASLTQRGLVSVNLASRSLARVQTPPADAPLAERVVFAAIESRANSLRDITRRSAPAFESAIARLRADGFLSSEETERRARLVAPVVMGAVALFGLIKVAVGVSRDRPVGFLVLLCAITLMVGFAMRPSAPIRSRRGDRALDLLRQKNAALRTTALERFDRLAPTDMALAVGLFGLSAVGSTSLMELNRTIYPPSSVVSSSSSDSSSSSSSCSGGSSCGGGGCGGCSS